MSIRKKLSYKYYIKWNLKNDTYNKSREDITNELQIKMYDEYIIKLNEFIKELDIIKKHINKINFNPNYRQIGGYKRCITDYPDIGYSKKYEQYKQAYKELMVDFLYYPDSNLDYEELSIKEIEILKEMATFLIQQAEINTKYLQ